MTTAFLYVRMSTTAQLEGDSLRRQVNRAVRYAERNHLEISPDDFRDIGVSGFDSSSVDHGQLGRFLSAIDEGRVPNGSFLLIESIDRLSRRTVHEAIDLLTQIMKGGVKVVLLMDDEEVFSWPIRDFAKLIKLLNKMHRAHDESVVKQDRGREVWDAKRADDKIMTRRCPSWLYTDRNRTRFKIRPAQESVVKRIFAEAAAGMGAHVITKRLNADGVHPFGPKADASKGWHPSSVKKILHNRAVLGELQPRATDGRIFPVKSRYYPRIIDDDLFHRAAARIAERRNGGGGRKGEFVTNLFAKVATCGYCGSPMYFVNKGKSEKSFLVCAGAKRGMFCHTSKGWRYDYFEASFFSFVTHIDLSLFFDVGRSQTELQTLVDIEERSRGKLEVVRKEYGRVVDLFRRLDTPSDYLIQEAQRLDREVQFVQSEHEQASRAVIAYRDEIAGQSSARRNLPEFINRLHNVIDPEIYTIRSAIAANLRSAIKSLALFNDGDEYLSKPSVARLMRNMRLSREEAQAIHAHQKAIEPFHLPWFQVDFGGIQKIKVVPDPADCLKFLYKRDGLELQTHGTHGEPLAASLPRPPDRYIAY